jgi:hypothetical protein
VLLKGHNGDSLPSCMLQMLSGVCFLEFRRPASGAECPIAWTQVCRPKGEGAALEPLMPLYQDISVTTLGDGERTSFWLDD